jgi:uncharacterized protein
MIVIPEALTFEWDGGNLDKNYIRHQVTNQEAEEVFSNEPLIVKEDEKHSTREQRYQALGRSNSKRKLFLSFTIRKNKVRIISIRDMNRKEKLIYEKH